MPKEIDRRKHPRVLLRALVDYESEDTFLYDYSKDLSQGGLFIQTDKPLKVNETIDLKFSLPDIAKVFEVKGQVRWVNPESVGGLMKGMGIAFQELSPEDKKLIQNYVLKMNDDN